VEVALHESERSLAITFNSIGDAVMATDAQSRIVRMNRVAEQLTGWPLKEALGQSLDEVFHIINQHTRLSLANPVSKVLETGKTQGLANDTVLVSRQGMECIIADSAAAIVDDETGRTVGVVLVFRDQTREYAMQATLRESHELLSLFIRNSPVYAYIKEVTPAQGVVLQASDNFQQMIGIPGSKMVGKTMSELFPGELGKKMIADDWAVASSGNVLTLDEDLNGRNYTTIKFPIVQGDKNLLAGYTIDITERNEMQAKLLASEKLAVMGRLIADVAHEINNPLAIIAGNTSLLEETVKEQATTIPDSEDKAKMLEKIKKATNRCKQIVAALFVSTSPTMLGIKSAKINEVINESLESLDDQIKRQNVKVVKALAPCLPIIKADGHRLMQVFVNMFRNACDAMPEGGKLMIATRLHKPKAGAHGKATEKEGNVSAIEIEISDTGVGILEKDLSKIFDPFVTTKKDGKGVGLGLSVSYGIIREHGGDISVTSKKGKGATFIIKIPYRT